MKYTYMWTLQVIIRSPSVWREWIEIYCTTGSRRFEKSPSVWREWIEIILAHDFRKTAVVSLRVEGVD